MVLPGVSGMYLVLVLGQYVVILDAIDGIRRSEFDPVLAVVLPLQHAQHACLRPRRRHRLRPSVGSATIVKRVLRASLVR